MKQPCPHTEEQILDFYHASGYLRIVAEVLYPKQLVAQKEWLKDSCNQLKHELGAAQKLYDQMLQLIVVEENMMEKLQASITYFRNHL